MFLTVIVHLLQLAGFQVLAGVFTSTVNFHLHELVEFFIGGVKSLFSGVFGMFGGRGSAADMAA